jgi:succinate dehydrogenase/fumarate reductase flavoprotein subunit
MNKSPTQTYDVIVIGGGASGMMAAGRAAENLARSSQFQEEVAVILLTLNAMKRNYWRTMEKLNNFSTRRLLCLG